MSQLEYKSRLPFPEFSGYHCIYLKTKLPNVTKSQFNIKFQNGDGTKVMKKNTKRKWLYLGLINISDEGRMDCLLDLDRREEGRPERPDTSRLSFSKDKYGKYFIT